MTNNEERIVVPKVYALLLECRDALFLSIQYAYSLEESFNLAKLEFEKQNPLKKGLNNPFVGSKIGLFAVKSVEELVNSLTTSEHHDDSQIEYQKVLEDVSKVMDNANKQNTTKPEQEVSVSADSKKNTLMDQIIKEKDATTLERNNSIFSKAEKAYLKAKIKEQKK